MTKPFNADELIVRIKTQLSLRETTRRLESTIRLLTTSSEEMAKQKKAIEEGEKKADSLLLNILPEYAAKELKEKGFIVPRRFPVATVLFADLVGFSKLCQGLTPEQIVGELNYLFVGFDFILERYNLEKIKTIGDGYMAAGGIPHPNSTSPSML
ncbi:MAG: adenylate/guanylate cyclase domain-containing protein [Bacteroidota bacterium]